MKSDSRRRPRLVVVGNGMAGMRALEECLARAPDRYEITVIGAEPHPNYNRILLSSVLAGDKTLDEIVINGPRWYAERGVRLMLGTRAVAIDRTARRVVLDDGNSVPYNKLLLATGSKPMAPPIPGLSLPNVRAFRDIADVEAMIKAAKTERRAVVIGGGLLGLEAAWGLKRRGMAVTLVHLMPTLMERQLDAAAAALLQRDLDARGITFFTNAQTDEISGTERAEAVVLADGRRIAADFVVLAVGIRPISTWRPAPSSTSIAAFWSATTWRPAIRTFTPSANASSTMVWCSAWWRRSGTRPASAVRASPEMLARSMCHRPLLPASRSPASTFSRSARWPPPTMPMKS
jgi:nitrite reductase (NADH) large subunit